MITVYVSIGNSDDKLSQICWSAFCDDVAYLINSRATHVHAACFSASAAPWQNAIWCLELPEDQAPQLQAGLSRLARRYRQDSIAWAQTDRVQMIGPAEPPSRPTLRDPQIVPFGESTC